MNPSKTLCCLLLTVAYLLVPYKLGAAERWDPKRLAGFPDPPPPLKLVEAYPSLEIPKLIAINRVPGSDWLLAVDHESDWGGPGRVYQFREESQPKLADLDMFLQLPEIIYGIAFDPKFTSNRFVYVGCNGRSDDLGEIATKVIRLRVDGDGPFRCDPKSASVIIEWKSNGHNGGDLVFGSDGMLFVSTGDGTSDSDIDRNGQNLATLNGGIIRIDVNDVDERQPYRIPGDNPFLDVANARGELWAYGLRNPWRLAYDRQSGQLWAGNNGQDLWESVYLIEKGANYGWSINESNHAFHIDQDVGPSAISPATVEHHHSEARSLTGGHVYRGAQHPWLVGAYVYGDYSTGNIWAVRHDGEKVIWNRLIARSRAQITGFGIDSQGELLVADHVGKIFRFAENQQSDSAEFPRLLSQTGLFADVGEESMLDGVHEYYVNSPLWSDGAEKRRWFALPEGAKIGFRERGAWDFPGDSVLVKTFAFPADGAGNLRRIETRLMTRRDGEWFGYSYRWNAAQDDAELVAAEGRDEVMDWIIEQEAQQQAAQQQGAQQTVRWHYPSRSECMVCHSRAAGFVLGLSTEQLNRDMLCPEQGPNVAAWQLSKIEQAGLIEGMQEDVVATDLPKLVDPYDESMGLEDRVRSYLHVNCASCHIHAGGGNSKIVLDYFTKRQDMAVLDLVPLHTKLGIEGAKLVAAGKPEQSVLFARLARRGANQMPPLGTNRVDGRAVELIRQWIKSLANQ